MNMNKMENNRHKSGIYIIVNTINGKVYIGKTVCFASRFTVYKSSFKNQSTIHINEYFLNALNKHGFENFTFEVLEYCDVSILSEKELYWMEHYHSTDHDYGYNLRKDSSTGMVPHDKTREKISKRILYEYETGIRNPETISKYFTEYWKNEENRTKMRRNVSEAKSSYFIQKKRDGTVVNVWKNINQILHHNPSYKWQNIYAACNGSKKSYRGYLWERKKELEEKEKGLVVEKDFLLQDLGNWRKLKYEVVDT